MLILSAMLILAQTLTKEFVNKKLLQEVLKFNGIYVSWSFPKTDLVTSFLNPEN